MLTRILDMNHGWHARRASEAQRHETEHARSRRRGQDAELGRRREQRIGERQARHVERDGEADAGRDRRGPRSGPRTHRPGAARDRAARPGRRRARCRPACPRPARAQTPQNTGPSTLARSMNTPALAKANTGTTSMLTHSPSRPSSRSSGDAVSVAKRARSSTATSLRLALVVGEHVVGVGRLDPVDEVRAPSVRTRPGRGRGGSGVSRPKMHADDGRFDAGLVERQASRSCRARCTGRSTGRRPGAAMTVTTIVAGRHHAARPGCSESA